ncbi:MAG: phosphodiester glycosidase family protein [Almyronema sp.]
MQRVSRLGLGLLLLALTGWLATKREPEPPVEKTLAAPTPQPSLAYVTYSLAHATLHVVTIPPHGYEVTVASATGLAPVRDVAESQTAIAALNAGFFDPQNAQTTSYIVHQGELTADPRQNPRLVGNPDLQPYLHQILNRSEFRRYQCGSETRYDITPHATPVPALCRLVEAVGAGPQLLPTDTSEAEGFITYSNGQLIRDALGAQRRNARTAIGITADGSLIWAMAAQQPDTAADSGVSLAEMADFMRSQGAIKALNLDGGSSSSLYYQGSLYLGRVDSQGNWIERPVYSVLLVQDQKNR